MKLFGIACGGILLIIAPRAVHGEESTNVAARRAMDAIRVELPFGARAGSMKAGMLCFPSSVLRVSDFVSSDREFRAITEQAVQDNLNASKDLEQLNIELKLTAIDASLCAKNYGMLGLSDRHSLSGRTTFKFMWRTAGVASSAWNAKTVDLKFGGKNPRHLEDLVPEAVNVVIQDAAASQHTAD